MIGLHSIYNWLNDYNEVEYKTIQILMHILCSYIFGINFVIIAREEERIT